MLLVELMTSGLKRSLRVLELVKFKDNDFLYVTSYQNGRENGFAVRGWDRQWVFSEDRRSDYMVLYTGKANEFGLGNMPSDEIYAHKRMFKDEHELARVLTVELEQELDLIEAKLAQKNSTLTGSVVGKVP